jgi:hypothetical protein
MDYSSEKFMVCWNRMVNGEKRRFFSCFPSCSRFIYYLKDIDLSEHAFFEVIMSDQYQKLYFDLDIKVDEIHEEVEPFVHGLLDCLVDHILEEYKKLGITLNLSKNILIFDSNSETKKSYHVIVDGYCLRNNKDNRILASMISRNIPLKYRQFIDEKVYSGKQQLRLYLSQKLNTGRIKKFNEQWTYHDQIITYQYPETEVRDEIKVFALFTSLFQSSCVSVSTNCKIIFLEEMDGKKEDGPKSEREEIEEDSCHEILSQLKAGEYKDLFDIYKFTKLSEGYIVLTRKKSAYCRVCERTHDSENAYLTLVNDDVLFVCHRLREKPLKVLTLDGKEDMDLNELYPVLFGQKAPSALTKMERLKKKS